MIQAAISWWRRTRERRLFRALERSRRPRTGGVNHKVPPEHHNRVTGG